MTSVTDVAGLALVFDDYIRSMSATRIIVEGLGSAMAHTQTAISSYEVLSNLPP